MNRIKFLLLLTSLGLASRNPLLASSKRSAGSSGATARNGEEDPQKEFREKWVESLIENLETEFDERSRIKLMEECGRDCAKSHAIQLAKSNRKNLNGFLSGLGGWIGEQNIIRRGKSIHVQYSRCFCPLVSEGPDRLPKTYCYCSLGWLKEMFETVLEAEVAAELVQSIKQGAASCKFVIRLK